VVGSWGLGPTMSVAELYDGAPSSPPPKIHDMPQRQFSVTAHTNLQMQFLKTNELKIIGIRFTR
jgi:hypothetical protein